MVANKNGIGINGDRASVKQKEKQNEDFWERVAEDPASGYKNEDNKDPLLNVDQQPDDNKKGDQAT